MTCALRTLAFTLSAALLMTAVLTTAEAQQKRVDQINQEQMRPH